MHVAAITPEPNRALLNGWRQILSLGIGVGASWLIFLGLSRVQYQNVTPPPPPIEDLREIELPMEPPPPAIRPREVPTVTASNLIVLAPVRSDSG